MTDMATATGGEHGKGMACPNLFHVFKLVCCIHVFFSPTAEALGSSAIVKVSEQTGAAPKPIPPRFPGSK